MAKFSHIPLPLRIHIIYQDQDIVVVNKPPHLRTVPGNATEAITTPQQQSSKLTASQAWKQVLRQYPTRIITEPQDDIDTFLCHIAQVDSYAKCLPHKWKAFQSFVKRNWHKYGANIFAEKDPIETILPQIFQRLTEAQRRLLPQATQHEESVLGQLLLLFPKTVTTNWHIVHRLDCETSGLLVVARTSTAAAALCRAWRERESVSKLYVARVRSPPLKNSSGSEWNTIQDPMKPSTTERLKWEIAESVNEENAKACMTLWRTTIESTNDCLELKPVTGRTHQLRVHCQAYFGGIVGDTLYGNSTATTSKNENEERLYLHAYQLSFPHPRTNEPVTFVQDPDW